MNESKFVESGSNPGTKSSSHDGVWVISKLSKSSLGTRNLSPGRVRVIILFQKWVILSHFETFNENKFHFLKIQ